MARTKEKPHKDDILESLEAAHSPEPKRRRKKKAAEVAEETGLVPASEVKPDLAYLPPPDRQLPAPTDQPQAPPFDPGSELAAPVHEGNGFSAKHQRRILPAHIKIIHDDVENGFQMGEDHAHGKMVIGFRSDPGQAVKDQLTDRRVMSYDGEAVNFQFDPSKKLWHTDATPDGRERAYQAANEISGKDIRYGFGRGR